MEMRDVISLSGMLLSAITAIVVIFVNQTLVYSKLSREKTWDIKFKAYSEILGVLKDAEIIYESGAFFSEEGDENDIEYRRRGWSKMKKIFDIHDRDYIILSDTFREHVSKLKEADFYEIPPVSLPPQYNAFRHSDRHRMITACHKVLFSEAKRELKIK